jgi:rhodanese-related sulfurtransferase
MEIETIDRDELKAKLDRGDEFKLAMTLHAWAFEAAHIPGSISVTSPTEAASQLDPEDEIVVYCSDVDCVASKIAYRALREAGFANVRRYAGGLSDWQDAGYPLEGGRVPGGR